MAGGTSTRAIGTLVGMVLAALGACGDDDDDTGPGADAGVDAGGEGEGGDAGADAGGDAGPHGTLPWAACGDFECATLEVPRDHQDPAGPTVTLSLLRMRALSPARRIGAILFNPGGPGGPMVEYAPASFRALAQSAPDFAARFDLVAFDPRGIGQSTAVDCVDDADMDAFMGSELTPDDEAEWTATAEWLQTFTDGCVARSPDLVAWVDTESTARDMDLIRAAMGEEQVNYIGSSYGTVLGATYATLFPERVRAFVLDSPVAPAVDVREHQARQVAAYERELGRFFEDCGADAGCSFHGGEGADALGAAYDALALSLDGAPLPAAGDRTLSQGQFLGAVQGLLRGGLWDQLAAGLADAEAGDGTALLPIADGFFGRRADGTWQNFLEALVPILLDDLPCPAGYDLAAVRSDAAELAATAPRIGSFAGGLTSYCAFWDVQRAAPRTPLDASAAPPMLVLAGRHDPATPYDGVQPFLDALGNGSHLVTWEGNGHGIASRDLCTIATTLSFMLDPTAPIDHDTCPAE